MQTRASLLFRIRDPQDQLAWSEFVALYAPLLHAYAMKNRLQDADAADLAQETLRNVLRAAPEFVYDPSRGSFRGWLFTVARNEIRKFASRQKVLATGDSNVRMMLNDVPAEEPSEGEWDREYRWNIFNWAAQRVRGSFRDNTWQAFWRTVVNNENIDAVASELKISVGAIYIARSRVTARIRQEVEAVHGDEP